MAGKGMYWFPLHVKDWLSNTDILLMTPAEEGAYIRLLCHAWTSEDCGLPDDDEQLSALSRLGAAWKKSGARLRARFTPIGGRLFNDRLVEEWQKVHNIREKKKLAADARWNKPEDSDAPAMQMHSTCIDSAYAERMPITITNNKQQSEEKQKHDQLTLIGVLSLDEQQKVWFSEWWASYWRKVSKGQAETSFRKRIRTRADFESLMENTRKQFPVMMAREPEARPHGATWLNNSRYTDEETAALLDSTRISAPAPVERIDRNLAAFEMFKRLQAAKENAQ